MGKMRLSQEGVVFALAAAMFAVFALTLNNFLTAGNLIALVRSVSILGILGLGMGLVVIGPGHRPRHGGHHGGSPVLGPVAGDRFRHAVRRPPWPLAAVLRRRHRLDQAAS